MDNDSRHDPALIRQEMGATRTRLTERLEALEQHVLGNVHNVTSAVNETVSNVKGAVNETVDNVRGAVGATVESVKESFDVERHVEHHPWLMVGGAVVAGFAAGKLLTLLARQAPPPLAPVAPTPTPAPVPPDGAARWSAAAAPTPSAAAAPKEEGLVASYLQTFQPELRKLKGLAIGALFGVLKDYLRPSIPETLRPQLSEVVDDVTTKLGGRPLRGHILDELQATFSQNPV